MGKNHSQVVCNLDLEKDFVANIITLNNTCNVSDKHAHTTDFQTPVMVANCNVSKTHTTGVQTIHHNHKL